MPTPPKNFHAICPSCNWLGVVVAGKWPAHERVTRTLDPLRWAQVETREPCHYSGTLHSTQTSL